MPTNCILLWFTYKLLSPSINVKRKTKPRAEFPSLFSNTYSHTTYKHTHKHISHAPPGFTI